jgi:phosphoglycolate phosphatase
MMVDSADLLSEGGSAPPLPERLRAIVFDVDGTLYDQRSLRLAMLAKLLRHALGNPATARRTFRVIREYRRCHEELRCLDGSSLDLYGEQISRTAARSGVDAAFARAVVRYWMEEVPLPLLSRHARPGLTPFVQQAHGLGVRLGVFSDYPCMKKVRALGLEPFMDAVFSAQDVAVQRLKPDPRGLLAALDHLGVPPQEAIYVGDRPEVDAVAASRAGLACVIVGRRRDPRRPSPFTGVSTFSELSALLFHAP